MLNNSLDPFESGVNLSIRPPNKSWKEVKKLSGNYNKKLNFI